MECDLGCLVPMFDATEEPTASCPRWATTKATVGLFAGDSLCPLYFSVAQLAAQKAAARVMSEQAKAAGDVEAKEAR